MSGAANWLPSIVTALLAFGASYLGYRQATRAARANAKIEAEKVDAQAYGRAKELYEAGIEQLEEQLKRLRDEINGWRDRTTLAEEAAARLQTRVAELELTIARMRRQLILAGVETTTQSGG